jgi:putative ABC transport system permease protein
MKLSSSIALFVVSIALLAFAYIFALNIDLVLLTTSLQLVMIILVAGTFLFFISLSGFFVRLVSQMKGVYFNGLNLFVLKQINSKIRTSYISMSFVCLMLFIAITSVSSGSSIAAAIRASYGANEIGTATSVSYTAAYIGIIFIVACASVLAIAQLSEASDNQERYALLSKLGAGEKLISGAIFKQVLIYFAAPLTLAIAHTIVGITILSEIVSALTNMSTFSTSLLAVIVIVLVYGSYFLMTYANAKRMATARQITANLF